MKLFRFSWLKLLAFILILLFSVLAFLVGTQSGSRWLLNTVMSQINGRMVQIEGTIWSGIRSKELEVTTPALKIVANDNALAVNWLSLLRARLQVEHLTTADLNIELFPTEPKLEEDSGSELSLPISIQVDKVSVGKFTLTDAKGKNLPVGLSNFDLENLVLNSTGDTTAELQSLTVTHPDVTSELNGTVTLDKLAYPWPMHLKLTTVNTGLHTQSPLCVDYLLGKSRDLRIQTTCQIDAQAEIDGGLEDLNIKLTADGVDQGLDLDVEAGLNLASSIPLTKAIIDLQVAKDMRLHTEIHSESREVASAVEGETQSVVSRLSGQVSTDRFNLGMVKADSRLDSDLNFVVDFNEQAQLQSLALKGGVFRGSRWGGEALNAGININADLSDVFVKEGVTAWESLRLANSDVLINLGDNTIETKGQFLATEQPLDGLQLHVDLQDLSQLTAGMAGTAEVKLNMLGNIRDHDIKASINYAPDVVDVESLTVSELAKARHGLGKEPLDLHFDLIGELSSTEGRYHWQANLDSLSLQHAGFVVEQKDTLALRFEQAVNDFLLEIGQTDLALTLPGEHDGLLQHKKTELGSGGWLTQGSFNELALDNRLLQLLGIEENLAATLAALEAKEIDNLSAAERQAHLQAIADVKNLIAVKKQITPIVYDGDWALNAQPGLAGTINLQRHAGSTILPLTHPLPLDLADIQVELGTTVDEEIQQSLVSVQGTGEQSKLHADLGIESGFAMVIKKATVALSSNDGGSLKAEINTSRDQERDQVQLWTADLDAQNFSLSDFSLGHLPEQSSLSLQGALNATIMQRNQILNLQPDIVIKPGSSWNEHALHGQIKALVDLTGVFALAQQIELDQSLAAPKWYQLKLEDVDTLISLGGSSIKLEGALGDEGDELKLDADMPTLAYWWPDLPGQIQADLLLSGNPEHHSLTLNFLYDSFLASDAEEQPLLFNLDLDGEVLFENTTPYSWRFAVDDLGASYASVALANQKPLVVNLNLLTDKQQFSWEVGEADLNLSYPDGRQSVIHHQYSQGQSQHWETQGSSTDMIASMPLYEYLLAMADALTDKKLLTAEKVAQVSPDDELVFDGAWDFKQEAQLSGRFDLVRKYTSGQWPFPTPVPLDFDRLSVQVDDGTETEQAAGYIAHAGGMHIQASGEGPNSNLDANVFLHPASPFMLEQAQVNLSLPDASTLNAHVFTGTDGEYLENVRFYGLVQTSGIPLDKVSYGAVPPGMINGDVHFNVILSEDNQPRQAFITGEFADDSRWNNQALQGNIDLGLYYQDPHNFRVNKADIDLRLGQSHINSKGAFGELDDSLVLAVKAPRLNDLWPGLPGSVNLDLKLDGTIADNVLVTKGRFSQGDFKAIGKAPIDFELRAAGGWQALTEEGYEGWAGTVDYLDVQHAGFEVTQAEPVKLSIIPQGVDAKPQWDVGASNVRVVLPGNHKITLEQDGSQGKTGQFDTRGAIRGFTLTPQLISDLQEAFGVELASRGESLNHGIVVRGRKAAEVNPPVFDLVWDFDFDGALSGTANLVKLKGDFLIPSEPPVALGLEKMELSLNSQPQGDNLSRLTANLDLVTKSKGSVQGTARLNLNGFNPVFDNNTQANIVGHMDDISWLTGLTGDLLELGGRVDLDVNANYRGGNWVTSGGVKVEELRIVEVENGIRLLNGTLDLGLNGNDVVINRLHFPSVIRIMPNEWRTRQWIEENPPAQNGSLDISGRWNLQSSRGQVQVLFDHYPVLQRTDRFAMISGEVNVDAALPRIVVGGKVTADAGWVSVDIKGTAPTLDSDVVIVRKGEEVPEAKPSELDLDLNFTVDLGPRFYVVGFGLDAGLVGAITIKQANNMLSAEGQFNTRGGAIEAYGQRLQIRRGRIAFQGDIANPVLDIEALRRNLEVEAGLRVVGNARNPKISLISYPEVSEVEKLSWLIMGRGPDSGGGDLAMLLTVGTSLLSGDATSEPLHRQIGLDDVAIRKGDVGESGSILPRRTVGDSTSYLGQNDISEQFIQLTKQLRQGVSVSIEQALSGSGTVARVSYNLIRNLTIDAKVGTVSGIEMVYRRFFRD